MIFIGFEGLFSHSKSIKNHFQVEVAMKCAPRRPRDVSSRLQDAPKTVPRRPKAPKTAPGRLQDGPRTPPGRSKTPPGRSKALPQDVPRRSPGCSKTPPRHQEAPRGAKTFPGRPKTPQETPRRPQHASKTFPRGSKTRVHFWMPFGCLLESLGGFLLGGKEFLGDFYLGGLGILRGFLFGVRNP